MSRSSLSWQERFSLGLRNVLFLLVLPAAGALYGPWWILTRGGGSPRPVAWPALVAITAGLALYAWCVWVFAQAGHGTPAPWDSPRRFVSIGPYRFVRNPIYIAAGLVIAGEAWLFLAPQLVVYLGLLAVGVHLYVFWIEEPALLRRFGHEYDTYRRTVPRWIPKPAERTDARG
jgi:protein-S-isoprenylcysteine O-methyltransferase Ste14